jgi:hypothetical protein
MRHDLEKDQKIVHNQGLAGSMLFKISSAHNKENNPVPKLNTVRRMDNDLKFLVYDALRRKYNMRRKELKQKAENY